MSDIFRALVLGVVQGLTEFLPVSSSGHLEIMNELMGSGSSLDSDLTMVILVHLGTAFSILYVFWKDIFEILKSLFTFQNNDSTQLAFKLLVSMVPAMFMGLLFDKQLEALFSGAIVWVGFFLVFTAMVLYFTSTKETSEKGNSVSYKNAVLIGVFQAIAVLPGVSRSGMTIASALVLGVDKEKAARFSFLMVLPVIFGKVLLDIVSGDMQVDASNRIPVLVALISSFLVGVVACKWMISLVKSSKLQYFAYYCGMVGLLTILYHFYG